jgi:hypothetical protein
VKAARIGGLDGQVVVQPGHESNEVPAIIVSLYGPRGGFLAGVSLLSGAAQALCEAAIECAGEAERAHGERLDRDEAARRRERPDTTVCCQRCERTQRVRFSECIAGGWPRCCRHTMRLQSTEADVAWAVRRQVHAGALEGLR